MKKPSVEEAKRAMKEDRIRSYTTNEAGNEVTAIKSWDSPGWVFFPEQPGPKENRPKEK